MEIRVVETILSQPLWIFLCFLIGTLSVTRFSISILKCVYVFFIRPPKNLLDYGRWAVITGPTDGIGKAMAFELARVGFNLVLVGRNPEKLNQVSSELKAEIPSVQLKTVVIDFSGEVRDRIRHLKDAITNVDVGLLVNNAGLSQITARFFHEIDEQTWGNLVKVNLEAPTVVTEAVLPYMLQRRRGAIINVGSGSTVIVPCFPLYSVYTGTKGYIKELSKSLYNEYKQSGIDVQCQLPSFVLTKITPGLNSSFFVPTTTQYARSAIRCVGYESQFIPYWPHFLQYLLFKLCPADWILERLVLRTTLMYRKLAMAREKRKGQRSSS